MPAVKPLQGRPLAVESPKSSSRTSGKESERVKGGKESERKGKVSDRKGKESDRKGKVKAKKKSKKKLEVGEMIEEEPGLWTVPKSMQRPHWVVPSGSLFCTHATWETGDTRKHHHHPPLPGGASHASTSCAPFMSYAGAQLDVKARPPPLSRTPTMPTLLLEDDSDANVPAAEKLPMDGASAASVAAASVAAVSAPEEVALPKPPRLQRVPTKPELRLAAADDDSHAEEKGIVKGPLPSVEPTATQPTVERNFAPNVYPSPPALAPAVPVSLPPTKQPVATPPEPVAASEPNTVEPARVAAVSAKGAPEEVAPPKPPRLGRVPTKPELRLAATDDDSHAAEKGIEQGLAAVEVSAVEPSFEALADGAGAKAGGRRSSLTNFLAGQAASLAAPVRAAFRSAVGSTSQQPGDSTDAPKD